MDTLNLARELIRRPSVSPADAGCQLLIEELLKAAGFTTERLRFGEVDNLWARRGSAAPALVFAGHTDVVPTGPREAWRADPFAATVEGGTLLGRGAADMKGSLAAMINACRRFAATYPAAAGSIGMLITSDEEGVADDGTLKVMQTLAGRGETFHYCIVGEPSSATRLGDTVRVGRRGSLSGIMTVRGVQGHVAYPERVRNPIHLVAPALAELAGTVWDEGNAYFPPTSWQASNIRAGTGAGNVVPGTLELDFNFRYATASTEESLRTRFEAILDRHALEYTVQWASSGPPFLTEPAELVAAVGRAVGRHMGIQPALSTGGGTSDGRFIARICAQVVELGPPNPSIHKLNEHIALGDLERLPRIYLDILRDLLA